MKAEQDGDDLGFEQMLNATTHGDAAALGSMDLYLQRQCDIRGCVAHGNHRWSTTGGQPIDLCDFHATAGGSLSDDEREVLAMALDEYVEGISELVLDKVHEALTDTSVLGEVDLYRERQAIAEAVLDRVRGDR